MRLLKSFDIEKEILGDNSMSSIDMIKLKYSRGVVGSL